MGDETTRLMVLMLTDIVGSVRTKHDAGTTAYASMLEKHDALCRRAVATEEGAVLQDIGDGLLASSPKASIAARAALRLQSDLHGERFDPPLRVRVGVHVGEVTHIGSDDAATPKLVGLAIDLTARLADLACPGQILLTRAAHDDAFQFVREDPSEGPAPRPIRWRAHGRYRLKGAEEPMEIYEVGAEGLAPLKAPPDSDKARRIGVAPRRFAALLAALLALAGGIALWTARTADPETASEKSARDAAHDEDRTPPPTVRAKLRRSLSGHGDTVWAVAFDPDSAKLASASSDRTVRLWSVASLEDPIVLQGHADSIHAVAFSPDQPLLASAGKEKSVRLWNTRNGEALGTLEGHTDAVGALCFRPDGSVLATGSNDKTIVLWDTAERRTMRTLQGHTDTVWAVCFSPTGHTLVSAGKDRSVRFWDPVSGQNLNTGREFTSWIFTAAFSRDGQTIATGSHETIKLWDAETGRVRHRLEGHTGNVYAVAFSPDGKLLASGAKDGTLRLWDVRSGTPTQTLDGHEGPVHGVAFSPDGKLLASASKDKTVGLWELQAVPKPQPVRTTARPQ